ncbi:hypothetical protein MKX01_004999 [Papaver californicum]|nr:hypothetical protein MKX01_004999 [Papaver californicum]
MLQKKRNDHEEEFQVWDCGSPLYDSYELVSLTHVIERNLMLLPFSVIRSSKRFTVSSRFSSGKDLIANAGTSTSMIRENSFKVSSSTLLSDHVMRKIIKKKRKRDTVIRKILSYISCGIKFNGLLF